MSLNEALELKPGDLIHDSHQGFLIIIENTGRCFPGTRIIDFAIYSLRTCSLYNALLSSSDITLISLAGKNQNEYESA